LMRSLRETGT